MSEYPVVVVDRVCALVELLLDGEVPDRLWFHEAGQLEPWVYILGERLPANKGEAWWVNGPIVPFGVPSLTLYRRRGGGVDTVPLIPDGRENPWKGEALADYRSPVEWANDRKAGRYAYMRTYEHREDP